MEKNKEPALRILDLKNRFTFKERLSPEISGLKERLKFFSNFEIFETFETSLAFKNQFFSDSLPLCFYSWAWTYKYLSFHLIPEKIWKINAKNKERHYLVKISENIKNGPKNLKNVSPENLGKNKELPALGKSQRSL